MSDIWGTVKGLFKLNDKKVYIDNFGFRLHYKITTVILILLGILVTSRQYFGDPIDCYSQVPLIEKLLDTYCWVHGTFTFEGVGYGKQTNEACIERELHDHPGRPPYKGALKTEPRHYASYYQWVWLVLLIQAAFFYAPHYIWKTWEGGRIKSLIGDLNSHVLDDTVKEKHQTAVLQYFKPQSGVHKVYAAKYFICELLCLINLIVQIVLTNSFLGNHFLNYGIEQQGWSCPAGKTPNLPKVFPIVTYCLVVGNGVVGVEDYYQAMCVLPINILNQKIFLCLWFWYLFLFITTVLGIIHRIITVFSPAVRSWRLRSCAKSVDGQTIDIIIKHSDIGDWFFLYELGRNMNPLYFAELLKVLSESWSDNQISKTEKTHLLPY